MAKENSKKEEKSVAGFAIPAGIMTGMGLGFVFGNLPAGIFIGLGAGFILFMIIRLLEK